MCIHGDLEGVPMQVLLHGLQTSICADAFADAFADLLFSLHL